MKLSILFLILALTFACSLVEAKTDIVIEFPNAEYNSITGNYTRDYCGVKNGKVSVDLELTRKEINSIGKAMKYSLDKWASETVNDKELAKKIVTTCENNRPPSVTIYIDEVGRSNITLMNCTDTSKYVRILNKLILNSAKVRELEPSNCKIK